MATAIVARTDTRGFTAWFGDFLRSELTPYPGRGLLVARMVISATITMILIMTFRIPGGAVGPLYAFLIARENMVSTAKSAINVSLAFGACALFMPIGARMFGSIPVTHFFWEAGSIFLIFFLIRTLDDYSVASGIGLVGTTVLAIWYLPGPAERNVELTLWSVLSPAIGAAVTIVVEAVFHAFQKQDVLTLGINHRLKTIEELLRCLATGEAVPTDLNRRITQEAMVGVGGLRRLATRSNYKQIYRARMNAIVSLTGRAIDFAAALVHAIPSLTQSDRAVAGDIARRLAVVELCLKGGYIPPVRKRAATSSTSPLLRELEEMFSLIPRVLEGTASLEEFEAFSNRSQPQTRILVRDAFQNPEHLHYALSGCLAGTLCYVIYMLLGWPGLATSVTTCVLTALSNVGSARQKQLLRVAGAVIGGFIFGMGAQIMVLPWLNDITGFTLLFMGVTAVAAWVATSSTRLSYCGLQIALAFYLVNVNEFHIQLSLSIARDRVMGVLLGIFMMWLAFERLHPKKAVDQMVETFNANLGLLAKLSAFSLPGHDAAAIARGQRLRARITGNFSAVNAQADAVPFEVGPLRNQHMAARDRIRRWQAALRSFFLLEMALLQYTAFAMAVTLSEQTLRDIEEFDGVCTQRLEAMAAYLKDQQAATPAPVPALPQTSAAWPEWVKTGSEEEKKRGIFPLVNELARILDRLWEEMQAAPLYAVE